MRKVLLLLTIVIVAATCLPLSASATDSPNKGQTKYALAQKPPKKKLTDLLVIPVAVLLTLIGFGYIALSVMGSTVTAQVTGYEQVLFINNDDSTRNPSRYKLEYQFSVNGEQYTGSVTRVFTSGSHMRQTIPVRYLPLWPHVNAEDSDMNPAGTVTLGVGVLALTFGVGRRLRNSNKKGRRSLDGRNRYG